MVPMCQIAMSMECWIGDVGLLRSAAGGDASVAGAEVGVAGSARRTSPRRRARLAGRGCRAGCWLDFTRPADSLLPGLVPAQDARCSAVGNRVMSAPVSATITSAVSGADAGDGADQVAEPLKGLDHHLDPVGELLDRGGVLVDQVQVHPGQERVVLGEPAGQRLGQLPGSSTAAAAWPGRPARPGRVRRRSAPRASPARRPR